MVLAVVLTELGLVEQAQVDKVLLVVAVSLMAVAAAVLAQLA